MGARVILSKHASYSKSTVQTQRGRIIYGLNMGSVRNVSGHMYTKMITISTVIGSLALGCIVLACGLRKGSTRNCYAFSTVSRNKTRGVMRAVNFNCKIRYTIAWSPQNGIWDNAGRYFSIKLLRFEGDR